MLFQVGSVQFTVIGGLNPHEYSRQSAGDYAAKDVIGALRPQEPVGEGDDVLKLKCKLFTLVSPGGLADMDALDQMRLDQSPVICVRGDGYNFGWRIVTELSECGRKLDISGVGKVIDFELSLKKVPPPSASSIATQLFGMAGGGLRGLFSSLLG